MSTWFVMNVADAPAVRHPVAGDWIRFEHPEERFPHIGVNIRVLQPGQPNAVYHSETTQEDFLVLSGRCLAIIAGEERVLGPWDLVHCPPGTPHVFVGMAPGPCAILMLGARIPGKRVEYPVEPLAARHGASVAAPTTSPDEAYAAWGGEFTPIPAPWPPAPAPSPSGNTDPAGG